MTSPDRHIDAIFVEPIVKSIGDGEALYLVPRGEPAPGIGSCSARQPVHQPADLRWSKSQLLEVQYNRGCIGAFSNVWHSGEVEEGRYYVEVRLDPGADFACDNQPSGKRCKLDRLRWLGFRPQ